VNPRGTQRHHEPQTHQTPPWMNCARGDLDTEDCARHYKHIEPIYRRHAFALVEYYAKRRAEIFACASGRRAPRRALGYLRSVRAVLNNLSGTATRKNKMQCATCAPDATASIPTRAPQVELRAVHGILFSHGRCETLKSAAAPLHTGVCRVATPPPSSKQQCAGPVSVSTVRRSHACSCMILVASALAAGTEYRYRNGQHSTVPS
jgi:hypothetical protein